MATTQLRLQSPWHEVKEQLKEIDGRLTDDILDFEGDNEDEMVERVAKVLRKDKEEVRAFIESVSYNKGKAS